MPEWGALGCGGVGWSSMGSGWGAVGVWPPSVAGWGRDPLTIILMEHRPDGAGERESGRVGRSVCAGLVHR